MRLLAWAFVEWVAYCFRLQMPLLVARRRRSSSETASSEARGKSPAMTESESIYTHIAGLTRLENAILLTSRSMKSCGDSMQPSRHKYDKKSPAGHNCSDRLIVKQNSHDSMNRVDSRISTLDNAIASR